MPGLGASPYPHTDVYPPLGISPNLPADWDKAGSANSAVTWLLPQSPRPHHEAIWAPSHQSSCEHTKVDKFKDFRSSVPRKEQRPNIYFVFYWRVHVFIVHGGWTIPPSQYRRLQHTHTHTCMHTYTPHVCAHLHMCTHVPTCMDTPHIHLTRVHT